MLFRYSAIFFFRFDVILIGVFMAGNDLKDLILLARQVIWQYQLEAYQVETLKTILKTLDKARNEIVLELDRMAVLAPGADYYAIQKHQIELLGELSDMTLGIQYQLTNDIYQASAVAGELSFKEYGDILSFDGKLAETVGFNFVQVSASQLQSMILGTPVGGHLLNDWVSRTFQHNLFDDIKDEITNGYLQGEGYKGLVKRIEQGFDITKRDAITLTRTYVAEVNNKAAESVYKANADIVESEEWCATLEVSMKSGSSTCLRCAALDGRSWPINEPHIRPPLHPRCRCFLQCRTKTYKELGLNIPELEEMARLYTERDGKLNIDVGGTRHIIDVGQFQGKFKDFLETRDRKYKESLIGPNRLELLEKGKIKFDDLVDENGDIVLLKDLMKK
jgi:SPP1 gp7 family putative phage head morphogenesis protein